MESLPAPTPGNPPPPPSERSRLLVVDDEPSTRAYLRELLSPHYTLEIFDNAKDALESIWRGPPPDLILSDVIMGGIDGLALLRTVRADPATALLPVLLITGSDDEETRVLGFEAGADDYINKPIRAREILARVRTHLDLARLRRYEGAEPPPPPDPAAADESRRVSEGRFRAIVSQAMAGVAELDPQGRYTLVNQHFCDLLGYTRAELLQRGFQEITHPDDLPRNQRAFDAMLADGQPHVAEKRLLRPDGSAIWICDCVSLIPGDARRAPRVAMIAIDVTERHQAEEALRLSEEHFRLVADSLRDYTIFTLDPHGCVNTWNEGGVRLKGYQPEEIIGRHASVFATPEDQAAKLLERTMAEAIAHDRAETEGWKVRKDGTRFWGGELLFPMRGSDGNLRGFVKICHDLTGRKAADDERARLLAAERSARCDAEAANAAKDRLLAAVSHELRTPLAPVQMAIYLLRREAQLSPAGRESLEMISRNVEIEAQLIGDLLDVSRIAHGKLELNLETVNLHDCVRRGLETCEGDWQAKSQELSLVLEAAEDEICGDAARLRQVFCNLIQNAIKFTPENGRISVRSRGGEPGWIVVEVVDDGMGIDAELLPRLFNVFEQGAPEITRVYGGLGLGLSISHAIVQSHGGRLTATSGGPGQGATFTVELPLRGG